MYFYDIKKINNLLKLKNKKILIITSKFHSKRTYFLSMINSLKKLNNLSVYQDVESGAGIRNLKKLLNKFEIPQYIIAVGGGSVMDIAKAYSCICYVKKKNFKNINFKKKVYTILIPTVLGSGAETSRGAILKNTNNSKIAIRHLLIKGDRTVYDLNICKLAPKKLQAEALYDCFAHALETYISKLSTKRVKTRSIKVMKKILNYKNKNIFNSKMKLKEVAKNSYSMGLNLSESSTCLPHRIQYSVSRFTNSSHAQCIIALHKGWIKKLERKNLEYIKISKKIYNDDTELTWKILKFKNNFNINYNLRSICISKKNFSKIINQVKGNLSADPIYNNKEDIKEILQYSI